MQTFNFKDTTLWQITKFTDCDIQIIKKHNKQNKLTEDNSDNIMNVNESRSKAVKFEKSVVKDKKKVRNDNEFIIFKIKNVKFADVLYRMMKQNFIHIIQKMLYAVVFNIIVENILTSELIAHKLMFKSEKSDLIVKIFKTEKINVNSIKTHCITNILYFLISSHTVIDIKDEWVKALFNFETEMNLIQKIILQSMKILYIMNMRLCLMNINNNETVLWDIYKNIKVKINSVSVLQSLLIIKNFSQLLVLEMIYVIVILIITKSHLFNIINIEITSLNDKRKI